MAAAFCIKNIVSDIFHFEKKPNMSVAICIKKIDVAVV